jgi:Peptidase A4 family
MASDDEFVKKQHHTLIPLNIPGAFTTPAPPEEFNINDTSPADLIRHGIYWRRPEPGDPPVMAAAWEALLSRRWYVKDRVVPYLVPRPARPHFPRKVTRVANGYTSSGWAGCVLTGQWIGAIGQWVVPTVSKPSEPQGTEYPGWWSSSWVGIGGDLAVENDLLQAGVDQEVLPNGQTNYFPWFEWWVPAPPPPCPDPTGCTNGYPNSWVNPTNGKYQYINPITIYQDSNKKPFSVSPGQTISVAVAYINNNTAGQISFGNVTTGQNFSITLQPPPTSQFDGKCVEWIMEAPGGGEPNTSLPKFTPVTFTNAAGCVTGNAAAGNPQNGQIWNIVSGSKTLTSTTIGNDTVTITFTG